MQKTNACYSSWGPLGEPTEPLVNQRPKILFKILVKTSEPLAFPYTAHTEHEELSATTRVLRSKRLRLLNMICR